VTQQAMLVAIQPDNQNKPPIKRTDLKREFIKNTIMAKGDFKEECNRTACNNKNAVFFNHSTRKYYCFPCAALINRMNPEADEIYGHALCLYHDKDEAAKSKLNPEQNPQEHSEV
jgi:hypothetical protein